MTEPSSGGASTRYCCTAGHGMEALVTTEVEKKLDATHVCPLPGKVLFSTCADIHSVRELKAAERLLLLVRHDSPVCISAQMTPARAASVLQSRLLGDRNEWVSALMTWSRLQRELASRKCTDIPPGPNLSVMRRREEETGREQHKEEERKNHVQMEEEEEEGQTVQRKRKTEKEERVRKRKLEEKTDEESQLEQQAFLKKRKGDKEKDESASTAPNSRHEKTEKGRHEKHEQTFISLSGAVSGPDSNGESLQNRAAQGADHSDGSSSRSTDDFVAQMPENVTTSGRKDKTLLHLARMEPELPSCFSVSFRISCKCTGSLNRLLSAQDVSKVIGVGLSRLLGWKVDLKNPQLEISIYLSDDYFLLGIPLTRKPLANRSYIKTTGLRSTVAWAMASLAPIQPGFCVVDPMCGVGTILIEAAQEHKTACFLGVDIDAGQLQKANTNVEFAELGNRIHLLKASSMVLPLPSASVDAVICDLPFGRKFGTRADMAANLPLIVSEMERVLCAGGTLVLLLSPQLSGLLKKLLSQNGTGSTSDRETKPQTSKHDRPPLCPSPKKLQTFQSRQGVQSSSAEEDHGVRPHRFSLRHEATLRVSLGVIDGLIHKYVKTGT